MAPIIAMHTFLFQDWLGTASPIELLWLANAVAGLFYSLRNLKDARADYLALRGVRNGRRRIAVNSLVIEVILVIKFSIYIGLGILAGLTPIAPGGPSLITMLVSTGLVLSSVLLTGVSYSNRKTTDYLLSHGLQNRDSKGKFIKNTEDSGDASQEG